MKSSVPKKRQLTDLLPNFDVYEWVYYSTIQIRGKYPSLIMGPFVDVINI